METWFVCMDEVMVLITDFSLVSMDQQGSAILPANHKAQTFITINIGHTCSCGLVPGSATLCCGPEKSKEKQIGIIKARSWGVNLLRMFTEAGSHRNAATSPSIYANVKHGSILNRESRNERRSILSEQSERKGVFMSCLLVESSARKRGSLPSEFTSSLLSLSLSATDDDATVEGVCANLHTVRVCVCDSYTNLYTHSHTLNFLPSFFYLPSPPVTTFTQPDHAGKRNDNSARE